MENKKQTRGDYLKSQHYGTLQRTQEYKYFCDNFIYNKSLCMSTEVEYMLKKSLEDNESPLSYDDYEQFYYDLDEYKSDLIEEINQDDDRTQEEKNDLIEELKGFDDIYDLENFAIDNLLDSNIDNYERQTEVMQWFIMDDRILYQLAERGEVVLNDTYWGRQAYGQAIEMDGVFIEIFKEWFLNMEWVKSQFKLDEEHNEVEE